MSLQVLSTVSEIRSAIAPKDSPKFEGRAAFHALLRDDVAALNSWAMQNLSAYIVLVGRDEAVAMLGLQEVNPAEVAPQFSLKKDGKTVYYGFANNPHNRPLALPRVGDYVDDAIAGLWALGDPLYWGSDGFIISAQHRLCMVLTASETDPTIKIPFVMIVGLPPEFADIIDRQRTRTTKDVSFRGVEISDSLLRDGVAEIIASQLPKVKKALNDNYTTTRNYLLLRMNGKNIHSSARTISEREILQCGSRFKKKALDDGTMSNELAILTRDVYRASLSDDGKIRDSFKWFPVSQLVTALVLYSNRNHTDSSDLEIDWDFVESFLEGLQSSTDTVGPFALALESVGKAKKKLGKATMPRVNVMACIVSMVSQFGEHGEIISGPYPDKKLEGKDAYPMFGGVDIGKQETEKKEKE